MNKLDRSKSTVTDCLMVWNIGHIRCRQLSLLWIYCHKFKIIEMKIFLWEDFVTTIFDLNIALSADLIGNFEIKIIVIPKKQIKNLHLYGEKHDQIYHYN